MNGEWWGLSAVLPGCSEGDADRLVPRTAYYQVRPHHSALPYSGVHWSADAFEVGVRCVLRRTDHAHTHTYAHAYSLHFKEDPHTHACPVVYACA
jgi:hypothetical protein